jgi:hypothetical protein
MNHRFLKKNKKLCGKKKEYVGSALFPKFISIELVDVTAVDKMATPFQPTGSNPWRATVSCYVILTVYCRVVY